MRNINFRVWDNNYKYMNYKVLVGMWGDDVMDDKNYTACSMYIHPENVDYKCKPHWCHFEPYNKDIKLMQCTGLKDKNGVEIYEGDVIKRNENIYEVIFNKACFKVSNIKYRNANLYLLEEISLDQVEIIGNIYENPELLQIK